MPNGSVLYLCESSGARVLAYGSGITQIGTEFQFNVETWDDLPLGEVGDNLFRSIDLSVKATGPYSIGIIPVVDGEALPEQAFSGVGSGVSLVCQAFISRRGTRIAGRLRSLSRGGDLEIENISIAFTPIRSFP